MISFSIKKRKIYLPLKKLKTLQYFEKYRVDVERDECCLTSFLYISYIFQIVKSRNDFNYSSFNHLGGI